MTATTPRQRLGRPRSPDGETNRREFAAIVRATVPGRAARRSSALSRFFAARCADVIHPAPPVAPVPWRACRISPDIAITETARASGVPASEDHHDDTR